jgi:putative Holliday junction resolvase
VNAADAPAPADLPSAGVLLGLDYGRRRIGVAASDALRLAAHPVGVISADDPEIMWAKISAAARTRDAVGAVVGLPLNMDGTEGPAARTVRAWGAELSARLALPVLFADERLSSFEADNMMRERGLNWRERKKRVDAISACVVLQSVLKS